MIPKVKLNDLIKIGNSPMSPKAQIVRIYTDDQKADGMCGDIEVVYYQDRLKGVKEDVVWNGEYWAFKNDSPSGTYVNIDLYPELK